MSETDQTYRSALPSSDSVRDIFLWKKKKQSVLLLSIATATWVLLKVYLFNFLTVISWAAMFVVTSLFLWANMLRFFNKEPPNLYGMLEVTEETALRTANSIRAWIEEGIRWMFWVAAEREWFVFAGTAAGLWLLSRVGGYVDLLTFLYTGVVMGMTIPVIYVRYKENLKRSEEWVKAQARRYHDMVDEKVVKNIKNKVTVTNENYKDKKVE
ncbi:PREDICTED: reticulon-like protein B13 [Fragaria vesca subsp. vesca]|uniref:reticulon-like protein B13 n=1 Tax=Fragaria vesca subsp. vesca TaxID=101020 RepID=UPI0002C304C3|nr:PREDICTED: reticulon-like protein B13 [Fragaria vesca subsp. vesca]